MTRPPLVSVILPTYNRAHTLARAVGSVLEDPFSDLELIVVDDASTDGTTALLERLCGPRVRTLRLHENRGPAGARNAGAANARGEILAFQDSDDLWLPGGLGVRVERLMAAPPSTGVCYGRLRKDLGPGRTMSHPGRDERVLEGLLFTALSRGNFIGLPAVVVRREAFETVGGFDEELRCLEDWELWLRLARRYEFAFLDRYVAGSPLSADGVNDAAGETLQSIARIAEGYLPSFDSLARANLHYLRANALMRSGRSRKARRAFLDAVLEDPRHAKSWYGLGASMVGRKRYARLKSVAARLRHGS